MFCGLCKKDKTEKEFDFRSDGWTPKQYCKECCGYLSTRNSRKVDKSKSPFRFHKNDFSGLHGPDKYGCTLKEREANLAELGFASYEYYLASKLWREIRWRVFKVKGRNCVVCRNKANRVHHIQYGLKDLNGESLANLIPICESCHELIEFEDGEKLTITGMRDKLKEVLKTTF